MKARLRPVEKIIVNNSVMLIGFLMIIIEAYMFVISAWRDWGHYLLLCHYLGFLVGIVYLTRFKYPLINGIYQFLFIYPLITNAGIFFDLEGNIGLINMDWYFVFTHAIHLSGLVIYVHKPIKTSRMGVFIGYAFLLNYLNLWWFFVVFFDLDPLGYFGIGHTGFLMILSISGIWFAANIMYLKKRNNCKDELVIRI